MISQGLALMGSGVAEGKRRAAEAAEAAISSPLLEDITIDGATGILINITGGPDLTLHEVNEASTLVQEAAHEDANIIFGSVIDSNAGDEVRITVIATGFDRHPVEKPVPTRDNTDRMRAPNRPPMISRPHDHAAQRTRDYPPPAQPAEARPEGSGEFVVPVARSARAESHDGIPIYEGEGAPIEPAGAEDSDSVYRDRKRAEFPRVHPSLRHALGEGEIESELDVPTFLRRHGTSG